MEGVRLDSGLRVMLHVVVFQLLQRDKSTRSGRVASGLQNLWGLCQTPPLQKGSVLGELSAFPDPNRGTHLLVGENVIAISDHKF